MFHPHCNPVGVGGVFWVFCFCLFTDEKTEAQKDSGSANCFSMVWVGFQDGLTCKAELIISLDFPGFSR